MEPAENRPDDMHKVMTGVTDDVPQWSQPGISRMTIHKTILGNSDDVPQWSRPGNGRMTRA